MHATSSMFFFFFEDMEVYANKSFHIMYWFSPLHETCVKPSFADLNVIT